MQSGWPELQQALPDQSIARKLIARLPKFLFLSQESERFGGRTDPIFVFFRDVFNFFVVK